MSINARLPCSSCKVQPGTTSCEGCAKKFCHRCLNDHRDALINKLEVLANNRNELKEEFDRSVNNNSVAAQQIDQWAKEMHQKIDQVAQKAKEQVQRATSRTSDGIRKKLNQVTEEIQQRQKIGEVLDTDVDSIRKDLQNLERNIQQMSQEIRIDTSNSQNINWSSLISVIGPTSNGHEHNPSKHAGGKKEPDRSAPPYYDNGQRNQAHVHAAAPLPPDPPAWAPYGIPQRFAQQNPNAQLSQPSNDRYSQTPPNAHKTYRCICCKSVNNYRVNAVNVCSVCKTKYDY